MRNIPVELRKHYEEQGWWTQDTLGELLARGDKPEIVALAQELKETFEEFVKLRVASEVFPREMLDMME